MFQPKEKGKFKNIIKKKLTFKSLHAINRFQRNGIKQKVTLHAKNIARFFFLTADGSMLERQTDDTLLV